MEYCPSCGEERPEEEAQVYECTRCHKEGFDCCIPGNGTICFECEEEEYEEE